jgi:hypothetical protein
MKCESDEITDLTGLFYFPGQSIPRKTLIYSDPAGFYKKLPSRNI